LIGFGRPAMVTVRDETRMPGDRCTRGLGYALDRLVKAGFQAKPYLEFHHFLFRFKHRRRAAFL
jgi:hypothetical protein